MPGELLLVPAKEVESLVFKIVVAGVTVSASVGLAEVLGLIHLL